MNNLRVSEYLKLLQLTNVNDFFLHYLVLILLLPILLTSIPLQKLDPRFLLIVAFSVSSVFFSSTIDELYMRARGLPGSSLLFLSFSFLATSVFSLVFLPVRVLILGLLNLFLNVLNHWWLRAKGKPVLDLFFHGLFFTVFFLMSYLFLRPLDYAGMLVAVIVFLGGVISELMRGVRDYHMASVNSSVAKIGVHGSLFMIIALFAAWVFLVSQATNELLFFPVMINGVLVPIQYFILPPLALFLVCPFLEAIRKSVDASRVRAIFRKRAILVISIFCIMFFAVFLTGAGYQTYAAPSIPYRIDVSVKTVISGPENWGVAFINFNYVDEVNHYYVLLNRDGTLELTKVVNGEKQYLSFVDTGLTPFRWHHFKVINLVDEIRVYIDDTPYISLVEKSPFHGDLVLIGEVSAKYAFFKDVHVSKL